MYLFEFKTKKARNRFVAYHVENVGTDYEISELDVLVADLEPQEVDLLNKKYKQITEEEN